MTKISKKILISAFAILMALAVIVMPFIYLNKTGKVYAEQQVIASSDYYSGFYNLPVVSCHTYGNDMSVARYDGILHQTLSFFSPTDNSFVIEFQGDGFLYLNRTGIGSTTESISSLSLLYSNVGSTGTAGNVTTTLPNTVTPYVINRDTTDYYLNFAYSGNAVYFNIWHSLGANDSFFNCDVVAITVSSSWGSQVRNWSTYWSNKYSNRSSSFAYYLTTFTYTDTNGATLNYCLPTLETYGYTTMYNVESIGDSAQYQAGLNKGFNDGRSAGYGQGYSAGQENGYTTGYNAGLIDGAESDYSFIGLIGATIDAPIKALTGLLNFEILGVNLSAFVYGLFSITLVIIIIKYIKGSK